MYVFVVKHGKGCGEGLSWLGYGYLVGSLSCFFWEVEGLKERLSLSNMHFLGALTPLVLRCRSVAVRSAWNTPWLS